LFLNIFLFGFSGDYTEAIQLDYDPNTVTYLELLKLFWDHHDPTAKFKKQVYFCILLFVYILLYITFNVFDNIFV